MRGRTILALALSPFYGLAVLLAVSPVTILANAIAGTIGTYALVLPLVAIGISLLAQVVIFVQTSRFAAAFSGLMSLGDQPDFFVALGRGSIVTLFGLMLFVLTSIAVVLVYFEIGGEELWWLDAARLKLALEQAARSKIAAERVFAFENLNLEGLLFLLRVSYMLFLSCLAILIMPRTLALGWSYDRTYTVSLLYVRFLVAMPIFAVTTLVASYTALSGVQMIAGPDAIDRIWLIFGRYSFETAFFAAMMFSFEALLLRAGLAQSEQEAAAAATADRNADPDLRALRQSWAERE